MSIFRGIEKREMEILISYLGIKQKEYRKGQYIYEAGEVIDSLGIVVSGALHLIKNDVWGNTQILDHIGPGETFAETYACIGTEPLLISVQAAEDSGIIFLNINRILNDSEIPCGLQSRLIKNLLEVTARKNLNLAKKVDLLTAKSIRERVMSYLSGEALKQGNSRIQIDRKSVV